MWMTMRRAMLTMMMTILILLITFVTATIVQGDDKDSSSFEFSFVSAHLSNPRRSGPLYREMVQVWFHIFMKIASHRKESQTMTLTIMINRHGDLPRGHHWVQAGGDAKAQDASGHTPVFYTTNRCSGIRCWWKQLCWFCTNFLQEKYFPNFIQEKFSTNFLQEKPRPQSTPCFPSLFTEGEATFYKHFINFCKQSMIGLAIVGNSLLFT